MGFQESAVNALDLGAGSLESPIDHAWKAALSGTALQGLSYGDSSRVFDLEGLPETQGRDVVRLFCHATNREWDLEVSSLFLSVPVSFTLHPSCSRGPLAGRQAGGISARRQAVLRSRPMLAGPFPGMLAPSAQAENFVSANCDFRTQVCS